jgi:hypothetical protein
MPTALTSSVTTYPNEDEVDYSDSDYKEYTDHTCEEAIVDSPEPREGSIGPEKHSVSKTKDCGKAVITPEKLNASDVRSDLPQRRLVSIHNWSMKALDGHPTVCNKADIMLIQEDTTKGPRESVPSTNPRSRSGTYNPARRFCKYVNTPAGCTKRASCTFSHQHKGTKCFKFEEHGGCTNKTCVFVHDDDYTRGHRFERYYR